MARRNVDVVVGFGGYVAMPAYFAARRRVPMVVHEANARAGLANRIGARFTPFVAQAMDSTIPGALTLGIPLRPAIVDLDRVAQRAAGRAAFGLDPELPCLFVFGGSLGARRINDAVVAAAPAVCGAGFQILHVIGNANSDQVDAAIMPTDYHAVNYVDRMDWAYAAADLALCRAGAMTCAELAAVGLPAVYVPLPIGNGEQQLNAAPTVQGGGGEFLADSDLSGAAVAHTVIRLLDDSARLTTMSLAAASRGMRESGQRLADLVGEAREAAAR
jgi:UDP-N-acetylglucosamine--N-acetylmuramyl-(pentapeptide) pyrophosphoryl-undecaprenol N-acetylglucosamine transferase